MAILTGWMVLVAVQIEGASIKVVSEFIYPTGFEPPEVVASGVPEMANLGPEDQGHLGQVLEEISRHFEIVVVDTAAGLASSVLWFNTWVDHNLLVVTPDPTSMTDAYALIKVLALHHHVSRFHLLLNLVKSETEGRQTSRPWSGWPPSF